MFEVVCNVTFCDVLWRPSNVCIQVYCDKPCLFNLENENESFKIVLYYPFSSCLLTIWLCVIFPFFSHTCWNACLIMKLSNPPSFRAIRALSASQSTFEIYTVDFQLFISYFLIVFFISFYTSSVVFWYFWYRFVLGTIFFKTIICSSVKMKSSHSIPLKLEQKQIDNNLKQIKSCWLCGV